MATLLLGGFQEFGTYVWYKQQRQPILVAVKVYPPEEEDNQDDYRQEGGDVHNLKKNAISRLNIPMEGK